MEKEIKEFEVEAEKIEKIYKKAEPLTLLTKKEADIITSFYGLDKKVRHTLRELGEKYGVTRERIRQIKANALKKIGYKD